MNQSSIIISTDEELALVCQLLFYQPTGYYSNTQLLHKDLKKESYCFLYKKVREWLHNQNKWQKYAPLPKNISRVSYDKISYPNCVHMCNLLFLTHDNYKDVVSRYKASIPLISNKSLEIAKSFKKIYNDFNNPFSYPTLLQCDGGTEFKKSVSQLMEAHYVTIRVIGAYSYWSLAFIERFNKTLAEMLYKIQYAVESINLNSRLIRAWVKYLSEVIDYLNNYLTCLIQVPDSSKWELALKEAIKLEKVESWPSTKYKHLVGKNKKNKLKKDDTVRYLLANAEWEEVSKNEPILYYLRNNDNGYPSRQGFVREELMYIDLEKVHYPPQSILEEKTHSRSINFVQFQHYSENPMFHR
ncbi:23152_t:CDS:2 [Cetraspora pellucida]|uniref:23152_t:CDS:1 n=1 Tax=Cetraspora pellucida TaxID=1433469 RepID=A0A9N8WHY9_9GLOM|nr:23152_t:CDS:2 [Cetraspora pellucida]